VNDSADDDVQPAAEMEARLRAVTIGEPEVLQGPVRLEPYDPRWPAWYEQLALRIRRALGHTVVRIEHAGSTSVPGLTAKPVIDIVLEVPDSTDESAFVPQLEHEGFVLRAREPEWFEHRLLKHGDPACNLHVFSAGCEEADRMLRFRDHLRTNAEDRTLYAGTKRELAARDWRYLQQYADAKTEVVAAINERATRAR